MKHFFPLIFLISLLVTSCKKDSETAVSNLNGGKIEVMGHGGSGFQTYTNDFPANSFISVKRAIDALGADGVEIDLQMSSDHVLFLYHDETLQTATNGYGQVSNSDSAYLAGLYFNQSMNSADFKKEKLVTLEEVLAYFSTYKKKPKISLDVKGLTGVNSKIKTDEKILVKKIMELVFKYDASTWVSMESYSGDFLQMFRSYEVGHIDLMVDAMDFPSAFEIAKEFGMDGIVIMNDKVSEKQIALAHQNNIKIVLYEVKTRGGCLDAVSKNPDAIQTDNIRMLQECLK